MLKYQMLRQNLTQVGRYTVTSLPCGLALAVLFVVLLPLVDWPCPKCGGVWGKGTPWGLTFLWSSCRICSKEMSSGTCPCWGCNSTMGGFWIFGWRKLMSLTWNELGWPVTTGFISNTDPEGKLEISGCCCKNCNRSSELPGPWIDIWWSVGCKGGLAGFFGTRGFRINGFSSGLKWGGWGGRRGSSRLLVGEFSSLAYTLRGPRTLEGFLSGGNGPKVWFRICPLLSGLFAAARNENPLFFCNFFVKLRLMPNTSQICTAKEWMPLSQLQNGQSMSNLFTYIFYLPWSLGFKQTQYVQQSSSGTCWRAACLGGQARFGGGNAGTGGQVFWHSTLPISQ